MFRVLEYVHGKNQVSTKTKNKQELIKMKETHNKITKTKTEDIKIKTRSK